MQMMIVKQLRGDATGRDRNGDVMIKLRAHLAYHSTGMPVLQIWANLCTTRYGGGVIYGAPPPGPLIRQLPR